MRGRAWHSSRPLGRSTWSGREAGGVGGGALDFPHRSEEVGSPYGLSQNDEKEPVVPSVCQQTDPRVTRLEPSQSHSAESLTETTRRPPLSSTQRLLTLIFFFFQCQSFFFSIFVRSDEAFRSAARPLGSRSLKKRSRLSAASRSSLSVIIKSLSV